MREPICFPAGTRQITVFPVPDCTAKPAVLLHCSREEAATVFALLNECCTLVTVDKTDWNRDFSPWKAKRVFRGGEDFEGGADEYLSELDSRLLPAAEQATGFVPERWLIAGYSLAGLFAIYALYRCTRFCAAASVSGSLWFDAFLNFMQTNRPQRIPDAVYFSVGDREHLTRDPRMAAVEACTLEAAGLFRREGIPTEFVRNPGNHFADIQQRTAQGILAICRESGKTS